MNPIITQKYIPSDGTMFSKQLDLNAASMCLKGKGGGHLASIF